MTERAAILLLQQEALAELLQLPRGARIDRVESPMGRPGVLLVRVRNAGWTVCDGASIRESTAIVSRRFGPDGSALGAVIDWGFDD